MKTLVTILLALSAGVCNSQGLQAVTYLERTHINFKVGTAIGFQFENQIESGGFFQKATVVEEPETGRPLRSENEFYGVYFAYPLINLNKTTVRMNVRTGISNEENFVITPSIHATYRLLKGITIGGGLGTRVFRPTFLVMVKVG